jgi:hypothetical protein
MPIIENNELFLQHKESLKVVEKQNEKTISDGSMELKLKLIVRELERAMAEIESLKAVINNG